MHAGEVGNEVGKAIAQCLLELILERRRRQTNIAW